MKLINTSNPYRVVREGYYEFEKDYKQFVIGTAPMFIRNPVAGGSPVRLAHRAEELALAFPEVVVNKGTGSEYVDLEQMSAMIWRILGEFFNLDWEDILDRVSTLESDLDNLQGKVDTLEGDLQTAHNNISALYTWRDEMLTWKNAIQSQVTSNTDAIANLI